MTATVQCQKMQCAPSRNQYCQQHCTLNDPSLGSHSNLTAVGEERDPCIIVDSNPKFRQHTLIAAASAGRRLGMIKITFVRRKITKKLYTSMVQPAPESRMTLALSLNSREANNYLKVSSGMRSKYFTT